MKNKRVGIFGLLAFALAALITPAVASAQEPCRDIHRNFYAPVPVIYRHDYRHDDWRERHIRERRHEDRCYRYHY